MVKLETAFESISNKLQKVLEGQGFKKQKIAASTSEEMAALFTGEGVAYSVVYFTDKKHMVLRSCAMTDEGPDNKWRVLATWMFDPENDSMKEAESIGNDFVEMVTASKVVKRVAQTKKKKSDDEGNADPKFFAKRLVGLFPELKDEIKEEENSYYPFRGVAFTEEKILPKINRLLETGTKQEITKLVSILSAQYGNGNADTRSIITIVILNAIDDKYRETLEETMSDNLKKSWGGARHYKGKNVKPEKVKKKKKGSDEGYTLND